MSDSPPTSGRLRLLHLEDDSTDAALIQARLTGEWPQCQIARVQSPDEFLTALQQGEVDVILSDFTMPGFDGLAALKLARQHRPGVPFIFLSGTIGEEHAVAALQLGATDYVIKDRMGRLAPAIRRALDEVRELGCRQNAERRLQEQAGLLDKARDAICVIDLEHRLTYLNQSAERLFGWSRASALGQPLAQLLVLTGSIPTFEMVRRVLKTDGAWTGELSLAARTGQALIIDSRWTLGRDAAGRPQSVLLINTDITEQKRLEQQVLRSQRIESIGTLAGWCRPLAGLCRKRTSSLSGRRPGGGCTSRLSCSSRRGRQPAPRASSSPP